MIQCKIIVTISSIIHICRMLNVSGSRFSGFGINKTLQISKTFLKMLEECKTTVFYL